MRRVLLVGLMLLGALVGCADARVDGGQAADDQSGSADAWAGAVCGALKPWREAIAGLNQRAATQMAQSTTAEQTQRNLVALVTDARDVTETARASVAAAGVPEVPGGATVAASFTASLEQTRDAYDQARSELLALPLADETTFYDGVVSVLGDLNRRYEQAGVDLTTLDAPELRAAFDRIPECR